jgi:hypothetical protein
MQFWREAQRRESRSRLCETPLLQQRVRGKAAIGDPSTPRTPVRMTAFLAVAPLPLSHSPASRDGAIPILLRVLCVADRLPPGDEIRGFFDAGLLAFIIGMQVELRGAVAVHAFLDFVAQKADIEVFRLTDEDGGQHSICRLFDVDEIAGRSSFHVGTPRPDVIAVCRPRLANPFDRLVYLYAHGVQGLTSGKPGPGFPLSVSHE